MRGTIAAIKSELMRDGFVLRYKTDETDDGLPPGEGTFLPCTFWLVDNLALIGEIEEATRIFERLLALRNDVGLLAEEWDVEVDRQVGNFPQALTHVGLVNSAYNLDRADERAPWRCAPPDCGTTGRHSAAVCLAGSACRLARVAREACLEMLPDARPLLLDHAVVDRVPSPAAVRDHVIAQRPLLGRADARAALRVIAR